MKTRICLVLSSFMFLFLALSACSGSGGDRILYVKTENTVHTLSGAQTGCKQFVFSGFLGGGIVKSNGKGNKDLEIEKYLTAPPRSKAYKDYYYIRAAASPMEMKHGYSMHRRNLTDQMLEAAGFRKMKSKTMVKPSGKSFPSALITSPDNRFLLYLMTDDTKSKGGAYNPFYGDSDLVVRDLKTGTEKTVLKSASNRKLFEMMLDFSKDGNSAFTISRDGESFKFVKIDMKTGVVKAFEEIYKGFDWKNFKWDDYISKRGAHAKFATAPDETKVLAYINMPNFSDKKCAHTVNHRLDSINLTENSIRTYSQGDGIIHALTWRDRSDDFIYILSTGGGCYPEYIDSMIYMMDRDGKEKTPLVTEKKSRIVNFGWSPDGKRIAYSGYGSDFISWIKLIDPETKEVKAVIDTKKIGGKVSAEKPVSLIFMDWVAD